MGMKNQKGGLVAKTKSIKQNPRKVMQDQINEIGGATSAIINELRIVNQNIIGLETLVLHLADFLKKKDEFIKFVDSKIEEVKKEEEKKIKKIDPGK
tara:strand:+ start:128 stop:418 length:291 start_codon:yes stop_codon:yes gene_type:complete